MPRLWERSIDAHREAVREAALDAVASLVAGPGLTAVTMSRVAQDAGIGRATLYKYFSDVDAVLTAWHERQVRSHLELVTQARDEPGAPVERLHRVLRAYATATVGHDGQGLAVLLHQGEHVVRARQHLRGLLAELIADGAAAGGIRADVAPTELSLYCLHALTAAGAVDDEEAVKRLVDVTMSGLRPPA